MLHAFTDPTPNPKSLLSNDPSDPSSPSPSLEENSHSSRNRAQVATLLAELAQRNALADASAAARLAHQAHDRRALDLQMNDRSGFGI